MFLQTVGGFGGAAPSGSPMMGPRMMGGATSPSNTMSGGGGSGAGFIRPPAPQQPNKPFDPFADLGKSVDHTASSLSFVWVDRGIRNYFYMWEYQNGESE